MALWILLAGLAALVLLLLLRPLLGNGSGPGSRAEHDIEVFRAQLKELDRDRERGLLDEREVAAARREVERRLLAAGDDVADGRTWRALPPVARGVFALVVALVIPLSGLAIYLQLGTPELPGQPFASRESDERTIAENDPRIGALREFERRVEADPSDPAAWVGLGRMRFALGRYEDAATAFDEAVTLTNRRADALALYGEALVQAAQGFITEGARAAFNEALSTEASEPRARFYLALASYQAGREEEALADWVDLAANASPDAPWLPTVRERIRAVALELGRDPEELLAPSSANTAAAEQATQIRNMVAGLAARLEETPNDLEGWRMLGRSYMVIGEPADAAAALARAADLAPDDAEVVAAQLVATMAAANDAPDLAATAPDLVARVLALDPNNVDGLWYAGITAVQNGQHDDAIGHWRRLLTVLPEDGEEYRIVQREIEAISQRR